MALLVGVTPKPHPAPPPFDVARPDLVVGIIFSIEVVSRIIAAGAFTNRRLARVGCCKWEARPYEDEDDFDEMFDLGVRHKRRARWWCDVGMFAPVGSSTGVFLVLRFVSSVLRQDTLFFSFFSFFASVSLCNVPFHPWPPARTLPMGITAEGWIHMPWRWQPACHRSGRRARVPCSDTPPGMSAGR